MDVQGRVAIVTGASRGIGREICLTLAEAGMDVVVAAKTAVASDPRLPGSVHDTAREVEERGAAALPHVVDVRDADALEALVAATLDRFGRIDALIHNAGALWWRPVRDTPLKRFDLVMDVNVRAAFVLSRAVSGHLVDAGRPGHVILMSPPLDLAPHPGAVAYSVSKLGMTMLAIGLAEELRESGIAVNSLWPATLIESLATINWKLGHAAVWRKPSIIAHATLALLRKEPSSCTGRQLIDEDFLREEGVTDFTPYRSDPDHEPPRVSYENFRGVLDLGSDSDPQETGPG